MGEKILKGDVIVKLGGLGNTKKGYQMSVSDEGIVLTQVGMLVPVQPFVLSFLIFCWEGFCSLGRGFGGWILELDLVALWSWTEGRLLMRGIISLQP
jgi:hypothetical protein